MTVPVNVYKEDLLAGPDCKIKLRLNHTKDVAEILAVGLGDQFEGFAKVEFRKNVWFGCGRHLRFYQGGRMDFLW